MWKTTLIFALQLNANISIDNFVHFFLVQCHWKIDCSFCLKMIFFHNFKEETLQFRDPFGKVHTFWKGHKFFCEISTFFWLVLVPIKKRRRFCKIFVAFSEYMNFILKECKHGVDQEMPKYCQHSLWMAPRLQTEKLSSSVENCFVDIRSLATT